MISSIETSSLSVIEKFAVTKQLKLLHGENINLIAANRLNV